MQCSSDSSAPGKVVSSFFYSQKVHVAENLVIEEEGEMILYHSGAHLMPVAGWPAVKFPRALGTV